ncbi:pentatricopeptide repeat-containing protein At5g10690 isoform X1 [Selaginella moellendorffii]|uniref:pentatricopeptide repeat-containing protein At5g10690 isoform X1 n=1 Tax=Selaginella moellendorffii TaxID=88036 RepID=UPI000D1C7AF1|nr:pentatricopeptide repeat-containing protein At5g10690 isoform X1 [Selaginella moellendorffii]|eukprot:XP_024532860.1 pentatricopeptide repeat-containing protein At5g10690 isoform X1 [Selaginella moellendorffii]
MAIACVGLGRFGASTAATFPEICSGSAIAPGYAPPPRQEFSGRKHGRNSRFHRQWRASWLLLSPETFLSRDLSRTTRGCAAVTSGNLDAALPEKGPGEFLLAEVRKRREELAALVRKDGERDPLWKQKLPLWAVRKLQGRELTKTIMELSRKRRLKEIFEILDCAKEKKLVNRKTMNAVMEACVHCGDIHRTMQLFQYMVQPDACGVDEITYGTLIKGLGKAGLLDAAFQILESMDLGTAPGKPKLSLIHLNTLINACANAGDARRARGALKRYHSVIKDEGPSLVTYNMLIKGYARSENPLEALKVREEMQLRGMQLNKLSWNSLVMACVRGQDMDAALEILEEMKEAGKYSVDLAPDVVTYTTLIKGLADAGNLDGVLKMVAEMKASTSCVIDRVGYTAIIDACITAGSPTDALTFFQEMECLAKEDRRLRPRVHAFLSMMRAFSEIGDVEKVSLLKSRMAVGSAGHIWAEDRLEADELLIEAAVVSGEITLARNVLKNMTSLNKALHLSQRGFTAIVRLQAMTNFTENMFQPFIISEQISLKASLESIIPSLKTLQPLSSSQKVKDVLMCFLDRDVLPVVSDENGQCIGAVHARDCNKVDSLLVDVMQDPPSLIPGTASVRTAIDFLVAPRVTLVGVSSGSGELSFLTREVLFSFLSQSSN